MNVPKYWWLGAAIVGAVVACAMIEHRSRRELTVGDEELRKQNQQLAELEQQRERASNFPVVAGDMVRSNQAEELAGLRAEAEALMKRSNELAQAIALAKSKSTAASTNEADIPPVLPENHEEEMRMSFQLRDTGLAFLRFADAHSDRGPASKEELAKYFPKSDQPPPDPNSYDLLYQGSLDDLKGIPIGTVAVTRSRQVWQRPDGKLVRDYGFLDGHCQSVGSDDNFKSFEAEHVIRTAQTGGGTR